MSTEAESQITVGCCFLTAHTYKRAIEGSMTPDSVSQGKEQENGLLVRYAFLHSYTARLTNTHPSHINRNLCA